MKNADKRSALLLAVTHFTVDFVCTYLLTVLSHELSYSRIILTALLYNGLAFAFQLPVGALADRWGLHRDLAAVGCLLVAVGGLFHQPIVICVLIGLGNACFHIGGGREALKRGGGAAGFAGKFVAPGALGIFLGPRQAVFSVPIMALFLGVLAVCLVLSRKEGKAAQQQNIPGVPLCRKKLVAVLGCMFLTVLLRSYMGTVLRYSQLGKGWWAFAFAVSIFLGKYLGGILADRYGAIPSGAVTQLAGGSLLVLSIWYPWFALPGILLFNTSMAVTVTALYRILPGYPGTMFGLTTFALYIGVLPRLLGWENLLFNWWGVALLCLVSALLLVGGLALMEGGERDAHILSPVPGPDIAS